MKNGDKLICIKDYDINGDSLYTKGESYHVIERKVNNSFWVECNASKYVSPYNPMLAPKRTQVPIEFFSKIDKISSFLLTEKEHIIYSRKFKLEKIKNA
jgi:hypothetical protein